MLMAILYWVAVDSRGTTVNRYHLVQGKFSARQQLKVTTMIDGENIAWAFLAAYTSLLMDGRIGFRHRFSLRHSYRTFRSRNADPGTLYFSECPLGALSDRYRVHGSALLLPEVL